MKFQQEKCRKEQNNGYKLYSNLEYTKIPPQDLIQKIINRVMFSLQTCYMLLLNIATFSLFTSQIPIYLNLISIRYLILLQIIVFPNKYKNKVFKSSIDGLTDFLKVTMTHNLQVTRLSDCQIFVISGDVR